MESINWMLFAPIIFLQFILQLVALSSCIKTERLNGPKWLWGLVIVISGLIGPVLYFTLARRDI